MSDTPNQFIQIADHYDALMAGVPYRHWVSFVLDVLRKLDCRPREVLDLACGTGAITELLHSSGFDMTGVDISAPMVEIARRKAAEKGLDIAYHVQDAAELSLGRQFDLVVSLFDSVNYMSDPARLALAFRRVGEHVRSGGLFIFDINTEYALAHGFFNQSNIGTMEYPRYVWTSEYDRAARLCTVNMVFEVRESDGSKRQFTEVHVQRAYRFDDLERMLRDAGFDAPDIYDNFAFRPTKRRTDRAVFVARKL